MFIVQQYILRVSLRRLRRPGLAPLPPASRHPKPRHAPPPRSSSSGCKNNLASLVYSLFFRSASLALPSYPPSSAHPLSPPSPVVLARRRVSSLFSLTTPSLFLNPRQPPHPLIDRLFLYFRQRVVFAVAVITASTLSAVGLVFPVFK